MILKYEDFLGKLRIVDVGSVKEISAIKVDRLIEEAIRFFNLTNFRIESGIKNLSSYGIAYSIANSEDSGEEVLTLVIPEGDVVLYLTYEDGNGYRIEFHDRDKKKVLYASSLDFLKALEEFNELCKFLTMLVPESITSYVRFKSITGVIQVAVFDDITRGCLLSPTELELLAYDAWNLDSSYLSYLKDIRYEELRFNVVRDENRDFLHCGKKNRYQAFLSTDFDEGYLLRLVSESNVIEYKVSKNFEDLIYEFSNLSYLVELLNKN